MHSLAAGGGRASPRLALLSTRCWLQEVPCGPNNGDDGAVWTSWEQHFNTTVSPHLIMSQSAWAAVGRSEAPHQWQPARGGGACCGSSCMKLSTLSRIGCTCTHGQLSQPIAQGKQFDDVG